MAEEGTAKRPNLSYFGGMLPKAMCSAKNSVGAACGSSSSSTSSSASIPVSTARSPVMAFDLHLDLRCFSFHHELLQLGEQALEDHCADAHLFGDDTLGQRPTVGVTLVCGDRFFLTQGQLRERGPSLARFACTCVHCLAFSVCTVWEHDGCEGCVSVAVSVSMPTRLCLFVSFLCLCSLEICDGVARRGL